MGTANDIQEMQQLLASIRRAIEEHGASAQEPAANARPPEPHAEDLLAEAPAAAAGQEREEWFDDDLEWVEPGQGAPAQDEAGAEAARGADFLVTRESMQAATEATAANPQARADRRDETSSAESMLARTGTEDATAGTVAGPAMGAAGVAAASATTTTATPAVHGQTVTPRFAVLSGGRSDPAVLGNSRLSAPVQARVKEAMARMERIEAAKRALGGDAALRRLVADLVEPLIENWLNEHLADIVERRVQAELDRLLGRTG